MDGIDYKTTDMARWGVGSGAGTGGNLTPTQGDLNFWELYSRLKELEDNPPEAVSITGMTVVGSQWEVNMSDGSTFGPFTLPIATFELKGDWLNEMLYYELDLVSVPGYGLYLVRIQHTTPALPATFDPDAVDDEDNPLYLQVFGEDAYVYDFGFSFPGRPGSGIETSAAMAGHVFGRAVSLLIGLPGSVAKLRVAPAAALAFGLEKNGVSIGSVNFALGATTGTFTFAADVAFAIGDIITMIRPTAIDSAAKELNVTFIGTRTS
jgi:hypothetical protein